MGICVVDTLISVHIGRIILLVHIGLKSVVPLVVVDMTLQSDVWRFLPKTKPGKLVKQAK